MQIEQKLAYDTALYNSKQHETLAKLKITKKVLSRVTGKAKVIHKML